MCNRKIWKAGGAACMLFLAGAVSADAVIWYRFDDQEPLTSTAGGVCVTNCVAETYPAYPRTITGNAYNDSNGTSPNVDYLPTYTNSAPACYGVYDPVTGTRVANRGCLHFHTTGSADRNGGMLRIAEDAALNALTNLTLEAFVRLPPDVPITSSYMRPVILKANQGFQGTWGMHVFESNLFHRCTLLYEDGTTGNCGWGNGSKSVRIDDGRWHHLAVTYDFAAQQVKLYVDYARIQTQAFPNSGKKAVGFYHPSNSPLQIGGNASHSTRRFNGEIDEVRISDEVLTAKQFLRYIPMREIDADTMYYLPFDQGAEDWFSTTAPPINASTNAPGSITLFYTGNEYPTTTNDVYGANMRNGVFATNSVANNGAIHLSVTAVGAHNGSSYQLTDPDYLITASNFTYEAFVKTDRETTKPADNEYADSFCLFFAGYMKVLMNGSNKRLLFRYSGSSGMMDQYVDPIDDGLWHHVAYVYDAAARTVTGYVDYRQVTTQVVGTGGSNVNIRVSGENSTYQTLPGCLDEVRITRRALSPAEFLTKRDCVTVPTLAHADFESDMDMSPDTGLIDEGVPSARTGGETPVLAGRVPGPIALDGVAMKDVRENRKSLRIDGGKIGWQVQSLLNQPTFTVEFFAKFDELDDIANLIRMSQGSDPDGVPLWGFYVSGGETKSLTLAAMKADGEIVHTGAVSFQESMCDGKWHH